MNNTLRAKGRNGVTFGKRTSVYDYKRPQSEKKKAESERQPRIRWARRLYSTRGGRSNNYVIIIQYSTGENSKSEKEYIHAHNSKPIG